MDTAADTGALRDAMALRYCQLTEATKQLQANVKALHDNKCIFFSYCWREVCCPLPYLWQLHRVSVLRSCILALPFSRLTNVTGIPARVDLQE